MTFTLTIQAGSSSTIFGILLLATGFSTGEGARELW
jgi:hypothetical protein